MVTEIAGNQSPDNPLLDPERQRKAKEYSRLRRRLGWVSSGFSGLLMIILIFTPLSRSLSGLVGWPQVTTSVAYFAVLLVAYTILLSPLSYYGGFVLPHRYGISTQTLGGWLADRAKGSLLSLLFGTATVALLYWFLAEFPDYWWLMGWGVMLFVTIALTFLGPVLLVPLFFKMQPLADPALKHRLEELARQARARVRGIYVINFSSRMTAANAALMGLGRTRRIVLSDTLLQHYPPDEVEVITAHEMGHHLHRDTFRLLAFQTATLLLGFCVVDTVLRVSAASLGLTGIADPAGLPYLALLFGIFSFLLAPLGNSFTRRVETQADEYALTLTANPQAFINSMTRLTNQNLAVAKPPAWEELLFYDHPSYNKRVEHANQFRPGKPNP